MQDAVEEIRAKIDIVDLVSGYTQLKKAGRNYKGLCPFHKEKTPSFMVSPDKQIAYCFGCHRGGDIFKFVEEVERVDFKEALAILAKRAGVNITQVAPELKSEKEVLYQMNAAAADLYHTELASNAAAQEYLVSRDLWPATIEEFGLGFAPARYDFLSFYLAKHYSRQDILRSGLVIARDVAGQEYFDRFRNRIMFPIRNVEGEVVGLTGRILTSDPDQAKYLNSAESLIYHKGRVLFNLDKAKVAIKEQDRVLLMEGQMDVITAYQHGFKNSVAVSGTALTDEQLRLLKRYTQNLYFCFDTDEAGRKATYRSAEMAVAAGFKVHVVPLSGKDPDEFIRKDKEGFMACVSVAPELFDYYFNTLGESFDLKTVAGKSAAAAYLLPLLKKVPNFIEQELLVQKLANLLAVSVPALDKELAKIKVEKSEKEEEKGGIIFTLEELLMGLIIQFPLVSTSWLADHHYSWSMEFSKKIAKSLSNTYNFNRLTFEAEATADEQERLKILSLLVEEQYVTFAEREVEEEMTKIWRKLTQDQQKNQQKELLLQLKTLDPATAAYQELLKEYNQLLK